jgi:hypothetical protein
MTVATVYESCRATPALQKLWDDLSVAANSLVQARLGKNEPRMIESKVEEYNNALALLSLNLGAQLTFSEWDVLKVEENA